MSREEVDVQLLDRYLKLLDIDDLVQLGRDEIKGTLSGLFLPAASDAYLRSDVRIMLVGKEPRKWGRSLQTLGSGPLTSAVLHAYVRSQMDCHRATAGAAPKRSKFLQFHQRLDATLGAHVQERNAVVWANLLCVSLNEGSPRKAITGERIAHLSRQLLEAQLDVLAPDLIVFASGHGYDRYLKSLFNGVYQTQAGFVKKFYWPFTSGRFTAWRVAHPQSHTREQARKILDAVRVEVASRRALRNNLHGLDQSSFSVVPLSMSGG